MRKPGRNLALYVAVMATLTAVPLARAGNDTWTSQTDGDWFDPSNWSLGASPTSNDNANFTGSALYFVTFAGRAATVNTLNLINSNAIVQLQEDGFYGSPTLELNNGTLGGLLFLQATDSFGPTLQIDNALTVTSSGFLDVFPSGSADSSATAYINNGTLTNNGFTSIETNTNINQTTINNNSGAGFSIGSSFRSVTAIQSSTSFNLNGGDLSLNDNSGLWIAAGTFNFAGGSINSSAEAPTIFQNPTTNGAIELYSSHLNTTIADGGGAVFTAFYHVTLDTNLASNTTLVMNANSFSGDATCFTPSTVTNYGTLTFRCNDGHFGYLTIGDGTGVIYNEGTLNATENSFGPEMVIQGSLVNDGTMHLGLDTHLQQNASNEAAWNVDAGANVYMDGTRFNQDAGTLGNTRASAMIVSSGGFNFNGGKVNLAVTLIGSYLSTGVSDGGGAQFNAYATCTLNGSLASHTALVVNDDGYYGSGFLYVQDGITNRGIINLNASAGSNSGVDLHVGNDSGTLTNAGEIDFQMNNGAFTDLYGNIINAHGAKVVVSGSGSHAQFNGNITNYGSFTLGRGATLVLADGYTYTAEILSSNEIDGTFLLNNGATIDMEPGSTLHLAAGTMTTHSGLNVAAGASVSADSGGQIIAAGGGNLVGHDGGSIIAGGGGNLLTHDGGSIIAGGGGNVISNDGGSLTATTLVGHDGGSVIIANALRPASSAGIPTASIIAQANGTITLNGGSLNADNLLEIDAGGTLTGFGTVTVGSATSAGNITASNGTLAINVPLAASGGSLGGTGLLTINGALAITGTTTLHGTVLATALTLQGNTGNWNSALDLTNAALILETDPASKAAALAILHDQLTAGAFQTAGIYSSTLPAGAAIALIDNNAFGQSTFRGASIDPNAILLVPALLGDANVDGKVDLNDLNTILNNLGTTTSDWTRGNFDGAPTIDLNDLNDVLNNLGTTYANNTTVLAAEALAGTLSPNNVPEPASLAILALSAPTLFKRRRR